MNIGENMLNFVNDDVVAIFTLVVMIFGIILLFKRRWTHFLGFAVIVSIAGFFIFDPMFIVNQTNDWIKQIIGG